MIILGYINSPHTICVSIYLPWTLLWSSFSIIKSHSANIPSLHNRAPTTSCLKQWSHNIWHKPPNYLVKINIMVVIVMPLYISQSRSLSSSNLRNGSIEMLPVFSSLWDEPHNAYVCPSDMPWWLFISLHFLSSSYPSYHKYYNLIHIIY